MDLAGKTVLVTGGAGFIGSHLVDVLRDCHVRVVDDLSTGKRENLETALAQNPVELRTGDIRNVEFIRDALEGVQVIFHLACRGVRHSIGNPEENHAVNATGTLVLLEEARRQEIERFVHVSTSEVYGTACYVPMDEQHPTLPETVYGGSKLAGESYARAYHRTYGLDTVVVRPFNNYGPRSHFEGDSGEVIPRFLVWALNHQPLRIFGDGLQTRDFIFVKDTAHWLRRVAECDDLVGQTVNLASGVETSIQTLAGTISELLSVEPRIEYLPPRPGDVLRHLGSMELLRSQLGFEPQTTLAQGLEQVAAYYREHPEGVQHLLNQVQTVNWTPQPQPSEQEASATEL